MPSLPDDTPVLLYALLSAGTEGGEALQTVLDRPGAFDQPLTLLRADGIAALASPLPSSAPLRRPAPETVLAYKKTIDAAHEGRTVVPLRFGTQADGPAGARELLRSRAEAIRRQLARLDGRTEMGVRLTLGSNATVPDEAATNPSAESGTAYLRARKAHYERAEAPLRAAVQAYRDALADEFIDSIHTVDPESEPPTASLAVLVARSAVDAVRRRVGEVAIEAVETAEVVGPWAPFSFASLSPADD